MAADSAHETVAREGEEAAAPLPLFALAGGFALATIVAIAAVGLSVAGHLGSTSPVVFVIGCFGAWGVFAGLLVARQQQGPPNP